MLPSCNDKIKFRLQEFCSCVCVHVFLAKLRKWLLYVRSVYNMRRSLRVQNKVILILFVSQSVRSSIITAPQL